MYYVYLNKIFLIILSIYLCVCFDLIGTRLNSYSSFSCSTIEPSNTSGKCSFGTSYSSSETNLLCLPSSMLIKLPKCKSKGSNDDESYASESLAS